MPRKLIPALLGIALIAFASPVRAGQTLNTVDRGWYDYTGFHIVNNQNYWVGWDRTWAYRNWFLFNIPDIPGLYTSATLRLYNPGPTTTGQPTAGYNSQDATETFELRDFTTSIANLVNGTDGLTAYNDMGTGAIYATLTVSNADDNKYLTLNLSSAAVADINAAQGGQFVIAGRLSTVAGGTTEEVLFSYSSLGSLANHPEHTQLLLDGGAASAPEPGALSLLALGIAGGGFFMRRAIGRG